MSVIPEEQRLPLVEKAISVAKTLLDFEESPYGKDDVPGHSQVPPPKELVYGVVEWESGWDPNNVSPAGAIGLGQIMPGDGSAELGWYNAVVSNYAANTQDRSLFVDDPDLYDPEKNLYVTAFGLGARYSQISEYPKEDVPHTWMNAALAYFGCVRNGKLDLKCDDGLHTAAEYRDNLYKIVKDKFGTKAADSLNEPDVDVRNITIPSVEEMLGSIANILQSATLIIGALIFGGLVIVGFYAASHPDEVKQAVSGAAKAAVI
jgi:hypothetical protein